jgi:hypothetical protein
MRKGSRMVGTLEERDAERARLAREEAGKYFRVPEGVPSEAAEIAEEALRAMVEVMRNPAPRSRDRLMAAVRLRDEVCGPPVQRVEHGEMSVRIEIGLGKERMVDGREREIEGKVVKEIPSGESAVGQGVGQLELPGRSGSRNLGGGASGVAPPASVPQGSPATEVTVRMATPPKVRKKRKDGVADGAV